MNVNEITVTFGERSFTVRATKTEWDSWREEVYEGTEAWDGSGIDYPTAAKCFADTVQCIIETIEDGN